MAKQKSVGAASFVSVIPSALSAICLSDRTFPIAHDFQLAKPDWPHFSWDQARLTHAEERFLLEMGTFVGVTKHLNSEEQLKFRIESLSLEALTTSQIEGEMLDRISVQSSIRRQFGLTVDRRKVGQAEQGHLLQKQRLHGNTECYILESLGGSFYTIIRTREFDRKARKIWSADDLANAIVEIAASPEAGTHLGAGLYKIRVAASGRGKRGGARVIYLLIVRQQQIYLLDAYAKNEKTDLTAAELSTLRKLAESLRGKS